MRIQRFCPSRLTDEPVMAAVESVKQMAAAASEGRGTSPVLKPAWASISWSCPLITAAAMPPMIRITKPNPVLNR